MTKHQGQPARFIKPEDLAKSGTEEAHQTALFCWCALNFGRYPELRYLFAIPNGGLRNIITASKLKAQGVKAGVPDMFLPVPRGKWHGLFIEMKKVGGSASKDQNAWLDGLNTMGYGAAVCVGWEQARDLLIKYLEFA